VDRRSGARDVPPLDDSRELALAADEFRDERRFGRLRAGVRDLARGA
jgi:hypothetical protein